MKRHADTSGEELTEAQRSAVDAVRRSAAVVAGAGSGKTRVLVERLGRAIGNAWGELDRVLAITFTEKAAAEMKARLRRSIPPRYRHRLETAWIGTIHACCARILRQHAPLVGIDPAFVIADENASGMAIRQCVRTELLALIAAGEPHAVRLVDALDFRNAVGALEELLAFRWHARRTLAATDSPDATEGEILSDLAAVYARVEDAYGDGLSRRGAADFEELEIRALELLKRHPEVREGYRRRFRHILVDEFQDTSDVQAAIVFELFSPKQNRLFIVGDPRQSIYRFRGANIDGFASALEAIGRQRGATIHLADNFRSREGIVAFVNRCQEALSDGLFGRLLSDGITPATEGMRAVRKDEGPSPAVAVIRVEVAPEAKVNERRVAEGEAIAAFVADLVERKQAGLCDIVCLFQALTGVALYEAALRRASIPCRVSGGRGFLERQEIADLFSALRCAANPDDGVALLCLLRSPLIGLSDDDLVLLAGPDGSRLKEEAALDPRCRLLGEIRRMARHGGPSEILRRVLAATGYERVCDALDPSGGASANVERFISLAESIERQGPTPLPDFTGYLGELKERSARLGDPPAAADATNAIRLMTVHAAKGLEFPVVILPDLFRSPPRAGGAWLFLRGSGIAFKLKDPVHPFGARRESQRYTALKEAEASAADAESKRLLYVAMTRARELLALPFHPGIAKEGPWHRWLFPGAERAIEDGIAAEWRPPPSPLPSPLRGEGGGLSSPSPLRGEGGGLSSPSPLRGEGGGLSSPSPLRGEGGVRGGFDPGFDQHRSRVASSPATPARRAGHESRVTSFTVSELECYDRCPQEYALKYALRLPASRIFAERAKGLAANVLGSVVHGVLERLDPGRRGEIDALIELECAANGVVPDAPARRQVREAIDAALALPIASVFTRGRRELRFGWRVGPAIVTGSIDWLLPTDAGLEVIDFKTDDVKREEVPRRAAGYDLQLVCYALAAEAATGEDVAATSLAFLTPGVVHRVPMDGRRRAEGMRRIDGIMEAILARRFAIEREPPCRTCPYHHNGMCGEDRMK